MRALKAERTETLHVCYKLKSSNRTAESWELSIMRREVQWQRKGYI